MSEYREKAEQLLHALGLAHPADAEERLVGVILAAIASVAATAREEAAKVQVVAPRAHTYASENADVYRAWDAGFEAGVDACRASIRARADAGTAEGRE